jgi:hypothetical protein
MANEISPTAAFADYCSTDVINETLAGVTETYATVCGSDVSWLQHLPSLLPDLPPVKARFSLLLIANRANAIGERALDLLVEQLHACPELQAVVDELTGDDDAPDLGQGWIAAPKGEA